ncbi:MAG: hypothetical protein AAFP89_23655 [Bacteroidota bacterium]
MRKIGFVLILSMLGLGLQAQGLFKTWNVKSVGVSFGVEQDRVNGFSGETLLRMVGQEDLLETKNINLENASKYSGVCENPHFHLQAIVAPGKWQNTEIHTSIMGIFGRVDAITYYSDNEFPNSWDNYMTLNTWSNEVGASLALIQRKRFGPASLYGGVGTNLGFSFANDLSIFTSETVTATDLSFASTSFNSFPEGEEFEYEQSYEELSFVNDYFPLSGGISQRVYLQAGASLTFFKRVELGVEGRYGKGYRKHFEGDWISTTNNAWGLFARWNLFGSASQ